MEVRQVIPRDAIPSVDSPAFDREYDGDDRDRVIVVDAAPPRAYPIRILHFHEIVNDVLDTGPIAVTWCPLCASAIVYDRRVGDRVLTFGVSGKLADDDLVMYDRETDSEWKQTLGRCIAGRLRGTALSHVPFSMMTVRDFKESAPEGGILTPPGGRSEASGSGDTRERIEYDSAPYDDYFEADGFGLDAHRGEGGRPWDRSDIDPKTVVIGLEFDDEALGVPIPTIEALGGTLTVTVGERSLVLFAGPAGVHAYFAEGYDFSPTDDRDSFRAAGTRWNPSTGRSEDGRSLTEAPAKRLFAFAWQDDHGTDSFYQSR